MGDVRLHDRRHLFASVAAVPEELKGQATSGSDALAGEPIAVSAD